MFLHQEKDKINFINSTQGKFAKFSICFLPDLCFILDNTETLMLKTKVKLIHLQQNNFGLYFVCFPTSY